jgi:toxin YoeB
VSSGIPIWSAEAWSDFGDFMRDDPKTAKRIVALINDALKHPTSGIGKPEQLKYALTGYWSRRITEENRLVCRVDATGMSIVQVRYHY